MTTEVFSLQHGRQITVRDMRPEDAELLVNLFYHLSPETLYKRFHAVLDNLPEQRVRQMATKLALIDPQLQVALIALHNGHAIGVARLHRIPGTTQAESAIVIQDDYHREGLGTHLLKLLRERALGAGITHLVAMVQAQNHPILHLIHHSGLKSRWRVEQGETCMVVDIRTSGIPKVISA